MRVHDCLKEMTAHIRVRVKAAGIKARVRISPRRSEPGIQVFPPAHNIEFSEGEQRTIRMIGLANQLTFIRGLPIIIEQMTDPHGMEFFLSAEAIETWTRNVMKWPDQRRPVDDQPSTVLVSASLNRE